MGKESLLVPQPGPSPAKTIQGPADQSWQGVAGVSTPASNSPQEAIRRDPRKNLVDPKLGTV